MSHSSFTPPGSSNAPLPPGVPNLSGAVLDGRYQIGAILGTGSMGAVFEASQLRLGRKVAIKVLKSTLMHRDHNIERFLREARAASQIRHPNVVEVIDYGDMPDHTVYTVMELLVGEDLSYRLNRVGRMPWDQARWILVQIARALCAAHRQGIIHRDIKPANCFLVAGVPGRELVKVLDFGIAKVNEAAAGNSQVLTGTSEILGTPSYMAPEMARGVSADPRSEVYSLGVLAYRMLGGKVPFEGNNAFDVLLRHATEPPPPLNKLNPQLAPSLVELVHRLIDKDPERRPQDMQKVESLLLSLDSHGRRCTPDPQTVNPMPPSAAHSGASSSHRELGDSSPLPPVPPLGSAKSPVTTGMPLRPAGRFSPPSSTPSPVRTGLTVPPGASPGGPPMHPRPDDASSHGPQSPNSRRPSSSADQTMLDPPPSLAGQLSVDKTALQPLVDPDPTDRTMLAVPTGPRPTDPTPVDKTMLSPPADPAPVDKTMLAVPTNPRSVDQTMLSSPADPAPVDKTMLAVPIGPRSADPTMLSPPADPSDTRSETLGSPHSSPGAPAHTEILERPDQSHPTSSPTVVLPTATSRGQTQIAPLQAPLRRPDATMVSPPATPSGHAPSASHYAAMMRPPTAGPSASPTQRKLGIGQWIVLAMTGIVLAIATGALIAWVLFGERQPTVATPAQPPQANNPAAAKPPERSDASPPVVAPNPAPQTPPPSPVDAQPSRPDPTDDLEPTPTAAEDTGPVALEEPPLGPELAAPTEPPSNPEPVTTPPSPRPESPPQPIEPAAPKTTKRPPPSSPSRPASDSTLKKRLAKAARKACKPTQRYTVSFLIDLGGRLNVPSVRPRDSIGDCILKVVQGQKQFRTRSSTAREQIVVEP